MMERCEHMVIGGTICPECAAKRRPIMNQIDMASKEMEALPKWAGGSGICPSCSAKDARIKELEKAVKWAMEHGDDCISLRHGDACLSKKFYAELLRRAGMEAK